MNLPRSLLPAKKFLQKNAADVAESAKIVYNKREQFYRIRKEQLWES